MTILLTYFEQVDVLIMLDVYSAGESRLQALMVDLCVVLFVVVAKLTRFLFRQSDFTFCACQHIARW